jgi:Arc/MetJ-type ribon-helix-helix transcriptional regulator
MATLSQKKFSISAEQTKFLDDYKRWGFSDQSSVVREALDHYMKELTRKERKNVLGQKAKELLADYSKDKELTACTSLDSEEFL